jgi:ribonuclease D
LYSRRARRRLQALDNRRVTTPAMQLIDDPASLARICRELENAPVVYLDTEFDSGRDGVRLCLVQVSGGGEVYLVDPFKLGDLRPLGAVLSGANRTWVLHAGQQDVPLLSASLETAPPRLFDTQVAWSLLTVEHSTSLAYLKYRLLGVRGEKTHQADDWRRRPLPEAQLAYAASDVTHLPALHAALVERAREIGRLDVIIAASEETLVPVVEPDQPLTVEAFRNAWQLEPEGQAVLRYLVDWYNGLDEAEKEIAPDNKGLFSLASRRPMTPEEVAGLRAVPRRAAHQFGKTLAAGIRRAVANVGDSLFVTIDPPPYATAAEILASGWLEAARAELCTELKLAPELVLPGRLMRRLRDAAIASGRLESAIDALSGWRRALVAEPLRAKLAAYPSLPA